MFANSINPLLFPMMQDLHLTCTNEIGAAVYESREVDPIRVTTATLHMLYMIHESNQLHVPIIFSDSWPSKALEDPDRIHAVLNAVMLLSHPDSVHQLDWDKTATMVLSELLWTFVGSPTTYDDFVRCVAVIIKLLGYVPEGKNLVVYEIYDASSKKLLNIPYRARLH